MRKSIKGAGYRQTRIKIDVFFFNFASSDCHHHCCCSNERSFKFKAFLFTSIENLLTFFAVTFTSYCQIIIVKSMFSSHQIDLSSRNSSFIHISSVLFSLIMSAIVRYIMFILTLKFLKILHFDEYNIIKFLECFRNNVMNIKSLKKTMNQTFLLLY